MNLPKPYSPGGLDVAVADGGTGASTAAAAATNLGLGTTDSPTFAGATFSGNVTFGVASQDYLLTNRSNRLAIQGQSNTVTGIDLYSLLGTGSNNLVLQLYSHGIPSDITNQSSVRLFWNSVDSAYWLEATKAGTGTAYPIKISTYAKTNQLVASTDGSVGVNVAAPAGKLHIDQSATGGAIPVLLLDQADVSEELVRCVGSAAAATLTQTLVNASDVTTATIQGYAKIYVQDDGNQITDGAYYIPFYSLA